MGAVFFFRVHSGLRRLLALRLLACGPAGAAPRRDRPGRGRRGRWDDRVRLEGAGFVGHGPLVVYFGLRSARAVVIETIA
jgi:hypothetical protein